MNLLPFLIAWLLLGIAVAVLAFMRKSVASKEDDVIHLSGDAAVVTGQQVEVAKRLEAIDKWGKRLTVLLLVTGLILGAFYAVQLWNESSRAGLQP